MKQRNKLWIRDGLLALGIASAVGLGYLYVTQDINQEKKNLTDKVREELLSLSDEVKLHGLYEIDNHPLSPLMFYVDVDDKTSVVRNINPFQDQLTISTNNGSENVWVDISRSGLEYRDQKGKRSVCSEIDSRTDACMHAKRETLRITNYIKQNMPKPRKDYNTRRQ